MEFPSHAALHRRLPDILMAEPMAYFQGQLIPARQAGLALSDAGFVMGATITDLCRTVRHALYRWEGHLARFRNSCRAVQLALPASVDELTNIARDLVAHNAHFLQAEQ